MKAAQLIQYGGKEAVAINEIPRPKVSEGKILVEVHAAGVNPFDWKVQQGYMKDSMPLQLPITLGGDLAGIVSEVGANVSGFTVGDEVYGQGSFFGGATGSFAEFDLALPTSLSKKPEKLSLAEAGAVPLAGVSAVQALFDHIKLSSGQKILIHGGAGGIGTMAVQIAKHIGAYVATTVSTDDIDFAKTLGVDEVIDYKTQQFEDVIKDFDAVFDTVGGDTNKRSYQVLKKGGVLVSMTTPPDEELAQKFDVTALVQGTKVNPERLAKLSELLDKGVLAVHIEKTFPLEEAGEALAYLQQTPPKGKVVIVI
jgi:alcohol dehydrogenase